MIDRDFLQPPTRRIRLADLESENSADSTAVVGSRCTISAKELPRPNRKQVTVVAASESGESRLDWHDAEHGLQSFTQATENLPTADPITKLTDVNPSRNDYRIVNVNPAMLLQALEGMWPFCGPTASSWTSRRRTGCRWRCRKAI